MLEKTKQGVVLCSEIYEELSLLRLTLPKCIERRWVTKGNLFFLDIQLKSASLNLKSFLLLGFLFLFFWNNFFSSATWQIFRTWTCYHISPSASPGKMDNLKCFLSLSHLGKEGERKKERERDVAHNAKTWSVALGFHRTTIIVEYVWNKDWRIGNTWIMDPHFILGSHVRT